MLLKPPGDEDAIFMDLPRRKSSPAFMPARSPTFTPHLSKALYTADSNQAGTGTYLRKTIQ